MAHGIERMAILASKLARLNEEINRLAKEKEDHCTYSTTWMTWVAMDALEKKLIDGFKQRGGNFYIEEKDVQARIDELNRVGIPTVYPKEVNRLKRELGIA